MLSPQGTIVGVQIEHPQIGGIGGFEGGGETSGRIKQSWLSRQGWFIDPVLFEIQPEIHTVLLGLSDQTFRH